MRGSESGATFRSHQLVRLASGGQRKDENRPFRLPGCMTSAIYTQLDMQNVRQPAVRQSKERTSRMPRYINRTLPVASIQDGYRNLVVGRLRLSKSETQIPNNSLNEGCGESGLRLFLSRGPDHIHESRLTDSTFWEPSHH